MRLSARLAAALLCAAPAMAGVQNVPGTWPTIQAALDHAKDFDTVLVQPGTYHEALILPAKSLTLSSAGGAAVTSIDASGLQARPVTFDSGPPFLETVTIRGFTLTGGQTSAGGAVYLNDNQILAMQDCIITGNSASYGGGVYALGEATLLNCQLVGNHASALGGGIFGPQVHLTGCLLSGNVADLSGGGGYYGYYEHCSFEANVAAQNGGGVAGVNTGPQLVDCSFRGNVAGGDGGGAAVFSVGSPFAVAGVAHCSFIDNQAQRGGGVSLKAQTSGTSVLFSLSNCSFSGNAAVLGDGAFSDSQASSSTCLRFCSFVGDGLQAAAAINADHCIARDPPPGGPFVSTLGSSIAVTWSDVQGGWPGLGNFDADPQFLDPLAPDLHLGFGSPCVDAGDPAYVATGEGLGCGGPPLDVDGQPRIQHGRVDVGADESEPDCNANGLGDLHDIAAGTSTDCDADGVPDECQPLVDCNGNGVRDTCDITSGTSADCNGNGVPDECENLPDCNGNGTPDACDLAAGTSHDCNGNGVPDECDIAQGLSLDADGDGWPDECESTLEVPGGYATIQAAIDAAPDFSTILLAPGTYTGPGNVELAFLGKVLRLEGEGGWAACTLDGDGAQIAALGADEWGGVTLRGLTLRNGVSTSGGALSAENGAVLHVEDCVFTACSAEQGGGAIGLRDGASGTLRRCVFLANHAENGGALRVSNAEAVIEHCTFEHNEAAQRGGTMHAQAGALVTMRDCILHGGKAQIGMELSLQGAGTLLGISYSDLAGGEDGISLGHHVWGAGMIEAAPLFANAGTGDLHLKPGSPCINSGDPSGPADPDGSPPDMGALAYEPWTVLDGGVAGSFGLPLLVANGPLTGDTQVVWTLSHGPPGGSFLLVVGFAQAGLPFQGGVLWPVPHALVPLSFGHLGEAAGHGRWPPGAPAGTGVWMQAWFADVGAVQGLAASDGVRGLSP